MLVWTGFHTKRELKSATDRGRWSWLENHQWMPTVTEAYPVWGSLEGASCCANTFPLWWRCAAVSAADVKEKQAASSELPLTPTSTPPPAPPPPLLHPTPPPPHLFLSPLPCSSVLRHAMRLLAMRDVLLKEWLLGRCARWSGWECSMHLSSRQVQFERKTHWDGAALRMQKAFLRWPWQWSASNFAEIRKLPPLLPLPTPPEMHIFTSSSSNKEQKLRWHLLIITTENPEPFPLIQPSAK